MLESKTASPRGELSVLDARGDTKVTWDPANAIEVTRARNKFEAMAKQGYNAFALAKTGMDTEERGELIREFDPTLERIVMSPAVVGG